MLELELRHLGIIRALERTLILIYIDIDWKEHLQKWHYYVMQLVGVAMGKEILYLSIKMKRMNYLRAVD